MSAYLDADLPGPARRRMEGHLAECAECRRLLAGLRLVIGALQRLPATERGPDRAQFVIAVRARLSANEPRAR
jgi:anti-sigma factor RsiW